MTQIQSVSVCARIDSTWRRNSSSGGSNAAMQIATCGAPGSGAGNSVIRMRPTAVVSSAPSRRRARTPMRTSGPERAAIRASPQKPPR